jgi:hypothetical protein
VKENYDDDKKVIISWKIQAKKLKDMGDEEEGKEKKKIGKNGQNMERETRLTR